jgi:hypothetical protein
MRHAGDVTYDVHFSYQNSDRPRMMQGEAGKTLFIFRNFSINMLWRLGRDLHQWSNGATPEIRREAKIQFAGIMTSMFLHAGLRGVPLYALVTTVVGALFGGDDEFERHLERTILGPQENDDTLDMIRRVVGGVVLDGTVGYGFGINVSERIGMPSLWFRAPYRDMQAQDQWQHYMGEFLGPAFSILGDTYTGLYGAMFEPGNLTRDIERVVPKFIRDGMRAGRYLSEGVTTWSGEEILENVNVTDAFKQAMGFTPAAIAERYRQNTRLQDRQRRIQRERRDLLRAVGDAVMSGEGISQRMLDDIADFNRRFPYQGLPIDRDSIMRSIRSRQSRSARGEFGVVLQTGLNRPLRDQEAPLIYGR